MDEIRKFEEEKKIFSDEDHKLLFQEELEKFAEKFSAKEIKKKFTSLIDNIYKNISDDEKVSLILGIILEQFPEPEVKVLLEKKLYGYGINLTISNNENDLLGGQIISAEIKNIPRKREELDANFSLICLTDLLEVIEKACSFEEALERRFPEERVWHCSFLYIFRSLFQKDDFCLLQKKGLINNCDQYEITFITTEKVIKNGSFLLRGIKPFPEKKE